MTSENDLLPKSASFERSRELSLSRSEEELVRDVRDLGAKVRSWSWKISLVYLGFVLWMCVSVIASSLLLLGAGMFVQTLGAGVIMLPVMIISFRIQDACHSCESAYRDSILALRLLRSR